MQKIAALRAAKGMTQEDLANATGISLRTVQRIEQGQVKPRPYSLKKIAEALQADYCTLYQPEGAGAANNLQSLFMGGSKQVFIAIFFSCCLAVMFILLLLNITSQILGTRFLSSTLFFKGDFQVIRVAISAAFVFALMQVYLLFLRGQLLSPLSYWVLLALFSAICMYLKFTGDYVNVAYLTLNNVQFYLSFICWLLLLFFGITYNALFRQAGISVRPAL